jgi:hypothetical protein
MNDAASKGGANRPNTFPQPEAFGTGEAVPKGEPARGGGKATASPPDKRRGRPPSHLLLKTSSELVKLCMGFADTVKNNPAFARAIKGNLQVFRSTLLRSVKAQFPLKRGRPTDPLMDAACRMVQQGLTVPEVLKSQIPDWDKQDPYFRLLACKGLHQAVARRKSAATKSRSN